MTSVLILPGYGDSDALIGNRYGSLSTLNTDRVHQDSWESPVMDDWLRRLDEAVSTTASSSRAGRT